MNKGTNPDPFVRIDTIRLSCPGFLLSPLLFFYYAFLFYLVVTNLIPFRHPKLLDIHSPLVLLKD